MSELTKEEKLKTDLEAKFPGAVSEVQVRRPRRVWFELTPAALPEAAAWLKEHGFDYLSTVSGFDEGENLGAFYHFTDNAMVATAKVKTPRTAPSIPSVLPSFPGALSYEKELEDMLGIKIQGLPPGRRYPLPDDFPTDQYPLRKDWKFVPPAEQKTEAK